MQNYKNMAPVNPRYADLPGIATDQPDIYETDDLPEADQPLTDTLVDQSDSVEKLSVSTKAAYEKFKGCQVDLSRADFTESLSRKPKQGADVGHGDWEISGSGEKETLPQRYHRLCAEVRQFLEDVNEAKTDLFKQETASDQEAADRLGPLNGAKLAAQMEACQSRLTDLNLEQVFGSELLVSLADPDGTAHRRLMAQLDGFKSRASKPVSTASQKGDPSSAPSGDGGQQLTYELYYKSDLSKQHEMERLTQLHDRIRGLEELVGVDKQKMSLLSAHSNNARSLTEIAHALSAKLSLLDAGNIEQIEPRLVALQQRLQAISEKKSQLEDTEKQAKINDLYDLLKRSEGLQPTLETVVESLTSLQHLHEQALQFSKCLSQLDTAQQHLATQLGNDETLLKDIQKSFAENIDVIQKNLAGVQTRIDTLSKQIKK